jgi:hypothetical protein
VSSFACPPVPEVRPSADPEASWGHRRGTGPGQKDELFFGYYLSAATMVNEDDGPAVPELVRRATLSPCHVDPVPAFVPALKELARSGVALEATCWPTPATPTGWPSTGRSRCGRPAPRS